MVPHASSTKYPSIVLLLTRPYLFNKLRYWVGAITFLVVSFAHWTANSLRDWLPIIGVLVMQADKSTIDYAKCSYEELLDIHDHIDQDKYPDRFEEIKKLLALKIENPKRALISNEKDHPKSKAYLGILFIFEILFWVVFIVISIRGYMLF